VNVGARSADGAQVAGGLAPGDTVVLYPPEAITAGARVRAGPASR
jgi:hypothetical protein